MKVTAQILNGRELADQLQSEIAARVARFTDQTRATPTLAAVLVGEDAASAVYVRNKRTACKKIGVESRLYLLPANTTTAQLEQQIDQLNHDDQVNGILVQLPLPPQI